MITEEAGLTGPEHGELRVTPLVEEGAQVAQGAPVACLRHSPEICLTAPMAATVGAIRLGPGRRLGEIVFFRESGGGRHEHALDGGLSDASLRRLMQGAGLWPLLRRRPFGHMPAPGERPAAIFVMASDTRPFAPDPEVALEGAERVFGEGLDALCHLTDGPVIVCHSSADLPLGTKRAHGQVKSLRCGPRHPQGLAGVRIHSAFPADLDAPVWDIHAEDVAMIGALLETGLVPETRLVHVAGGALRESRFVRTQPGADLRGLTYGEVLPGPHMLMTGSPLDGREAHWLGTRDRQVTVLPRGPRRRGGHWFIEALTGSAMPRPIIPTSALTHALGGGLPAAPLARALAAGDDETAMKLGALSLLEEDVALADYVLGGHGTLAAALRRMLDRTETEFAA